MSRKQYLVVQKGFVVFSVLSMALGTSFNPFNPQFPQLNMKYVELTSSSKFFAL